MGLGPKTYRLPFRSSLQLSYECDQGMNVTHVQSQLFISAPNLPFKTLNISDTINPVI